ncbi:riboflavin synthase [Anaplasmataceae bacterium AB001_6]|nr:riboflavin synthase [Anaplasmataceae bacterium AB001_6]
MFTGIINNISTIDFVRQKENEDVLLAIKNNNLAKKTKIGASIAVNGICLTVTQIKDSCLYFELSKETMNRTSFQNIQKGNFVNLESSVRIGDPLDGHIVTGHVDGLAKIESIERIKQSHKVDCSIDKNLRKFIAPKGSIALDGISLTINDITEDGLFSVNIISHTWHNTTFQYKKLGNTMNVEVDIIARYVLNAQNQE